MSDKKRIYTVPVVFMGEFKIKASSKAQAEEYAEKHCNMDELNENENPIQSRRRTS